MCQEPYTLVQHSQRTIPDFGPNNDPNWLVPVTVAKKDGEFSGFAEQIVVAMSKNLSNNSPLVMMI
ncbi:hypothetical protein CHS0354_041754 [Potamilus streckersoni]|uniref:Uncharacterized protein n=1 Tax=Potamilus streckersoni TaxID=2493646 RepID=A0AAE0T1T5_9BIVA|nr:hypothetical protein CHS0354_041754 [Potamilus streckersoni]